MKQISDFESSDCRKVRPLLDDFVAEELSIESNRFILGHLELCPGCERLRQQRVEIRDALRSEWEAQPVPIGLRERLEQVGRPNWLPLRLAAGLLTPLLALFFYGQLVGFEINSTIVDHLSHIAADHLLCQGRPATEDSVPFDANEAGFDRLLTERGEFRLVAVQECANDSAHFTHYIFEGDSGRVSLAVEPRDSRSTLPRHNSDGRRMLAGREVRSFRIAGLGQPEDLSMAALETPDYFVYVIADDHDSLQTLALTEALLPTLGRALRQS